jgi:hypothetical protein
MFCELSAAPIACWECDGGTGGGEGEGLSGISGILDIRNEAFGSGITLINTRRGIRSKLLEITKDRNNVPAFVHHSLKPYRGDGLISDLIQVN